MLHYNKLQKNLQITSNNFFLRIYHSKLSTKKRNDRTERHKILCYLKKMCINTITSRYLKMNAISAGLFYKHFWISCYYGLLGFLTIDNYIVLCKFFTINSKKLSFILKKDSSAEQGKNYEL